ncbi:cupin domain-containing protein [Pendulispora albinea]|uniref:Cupin domain-containing protein n=1 Tax=Pendulispora albinea TaxID=2741071 RepID=A0ABZ2M1A5_9BACT
MSNTTFRSHREQTFKTFSPGVHVCVLRRHGAASGEERTIEAGMTLLFRMDEGARAPHHEHPGGEETYLVSGKLRVGERVLLPGDYLWTAPGEAHDALAEEDSVFFVVLPDGLRFTGA